MRTTREQLWKAEMEHGHPLNDINETVDHLLSASVEKGRDEPPQVDETVEVDEEKEEGNLGQYRTDDFSEEHSSSRVEYSDEHTPWYLRVQQPSIEQAESPLAARQRIPELPDHSPSLLQPLLEHVSRELGMDDLTILDLRSLDPPPALGANLLMIIGTARSEKHLHVSADRLCRWLRSTYGLRPYADGLLGRNELKLKMRRKAKRSRLLSAVGAKATADSEVDDGIRTGWVCVNVGRVEGGELPKSEEETRREERIVGFGTQTTGSNVVVQMMTEEKRGDVDLENLWEEVLQRASKTKSAPEADSTERTADDSMQETSTASTERKPEHSVPYFALADETQAENTQLNA
jgi:hypothetical protein